MSRPVYDKVCVSCGKKFRTLILVKDYCSYPCLKEIKDGVDRCVSCGGELGNDECINTDCHKAHGEVSSINPKLCKECADED